MKVIFQEAMMRSWKSIPVEGVAGVIDGKKEGAG
jgi:hypothetical protein